MFGVGPTLIIAAVLGVGVFDIPLTVAAPVAAVLMCVAAYVASREISTLHLGMAVVISATVKPLLKFVTAQSGRGLPDWLQAAATALSSDSVVIAVSVVAFALALVWGIFGPLRHLKSVDDLLKEHEGR